MKLLFDQNLSHRLADQLQDLYPGSTHVRRLTFDLATDREVWDYAKANGYAVVSKDSDFSDLSFVYGSPPKVVWIRRVNCSTREAAALLRTHHAVVVATEHDDNVSMIVLF